MRLLLLLLLILTSYTSNQNPNCATASHQAGRQILQANLRVTPLSLGIQTVGGLFTKVIPRNTPIPTKKRLLFVTGADNQTKAWVNVYLGEREMVADNKFLKKLLVEDIPPAPQGLEKYKVTFEVNASGTLRVSAKSISTGKKKQIIMPSSGGLSKNEIENMVKEGEKFATEDKLRRKRVEAVFHANAVLKIAQNKMKEYHGQLPQKHTNQLVEHVDKLRDLLEQENVVDPQALRSETDQLQQIISNVSEHVRRRANGSERVGPVNALARVADENQWKQEENNTDQVCKSIYMDGHELYHPD